MMQMEFGEKLKKCREERGMTQQTLADKLYVTRQAVSRWECGARYPDLITAKHIAEELEISLDELVSGEKYVRDIEKEPIITAPVSLLIQTALYAIVCVPYLLMCFFYVGINIPYAVSLYDTTDLSMNMYFVVSIVSSFILLLVMGTGLYYSVRNELSPNRVGWIMSIRFFVDIAIDAAMLLIMFPMLRSGNGTLAWSSRLRLLFHFAMPFLILGFFNAKKSVNVKYVYIAAGVFVLFLLYDAGTFVHYINYSINVAKNSDMALGMDMNHAVNLVHLIGNLAYMFLLVFQAYTLNKKRMIT